jgi:hypothetical protein
VLLLIDLLLDLRSWLPKRSPNWRVECMRVYRRSPQHSTVTVLGWAEAKYDYWKELEPHPIFGPPVAFQSESEARDWIDRNFTSRYLAEGMRVYRPGDWRPFYTRELSADEGKKRFLKSLQRERRSRDESLNYPEDWAELKRQVLVRDAHRCANCGSSGEMHVHHIVPLSKGGTNNLTNLKALCRDCHVLVHPHMKDQVRDFD